MDEMQPRLQGVQKPPALAAIDQPEDAERQNVHSQIERQKSPCQYIRGKQETHNHTERENGEDDRKYYNQKGKRARLNPDQ